MTGLFNKQCPSCHGVGYTVDPILDDGTGPKEYCEYCGGSGAIQNKKLYYTCLGHLSGYARYKKARIRLMVGAKK